MISQEHQPDVLGEPSGFADVMSASSSTIRMLSPLEGKRSSLSAKDSLGQDVCPICKGAGLLRRDVLWGHPDFGKTLTCVCQEHRQRKLRQSKMLALSEQFGFDREHEFATFQRQVKGVQEAYRGAKEIADQLCTWGTQRAGANRTGEPSFLPRKWLVLRGPVGTGKTHLAMAVVSASLEASIIALFVTVPDLLDYLRTTFGPDASVGYDEVFTQLRDAELLVLDDLGAQHSTPWAAEKLYQLFNYRYNKRLPTVVSLNTSKWPFLDERLSSRLQDASLVTLVDLDDALDYRVYQGKTTVRRDTSNRKNR